VSSLFWVAFLLVGVAAAAILVPRRRIMEFLTLGLVFGLGLAWVIIYVGSVRLRFWVIANPLITLGGVPLLISAAWIPAVLIFAHFFPRERTPSLILGYIALFAAGSSGIQWLLARTGYWISLRWSFLHTFLLALGTHSIITAAMLTIGDYKRLRQRAR